MNNKLQLDFNKHMRLIDTTVNFSNEVESLKTNKLLALNPDEDYDGLTSMDLALMFWRNIADKPNELQKFMNLIPHSNNEALDWLIFSQAFSCARHEILNKYSNSFEYLNYGVADENEVMMLQIIMINSFALHHNLTQEEVNELGKKYGKLHELG